jgi:(S)-sulfolactate dehydrogenase
MSDIVITEFMDEAAIAQILHGRDVHYDPHLVDKPDELVRALADCRALIVRNRTQVRGALLDHAPQLKTVGRLGVGLDNIDVEACRARGIAVRPASGANDLAVAEYVIGAALLLLRRAWFASAQVAAGQWPRTQSIGCELAGKRLGLVGFGAIARLTAHKALALDMQVAAYDPFLRADDAAFGAVQPLALSDLLARSDVLSLHVPLTAQTRHMLDAAALAAMPRGALLINAARGGVVDEAALAQALREGRLGGAALDVFEHEPLDAAHGVLFADLPNVVLTPHIAGVTEESNVRVSAVIARAILADIG